MNDSKLNVTEPKPVQLYVQNDVPVPMTLEQVRVITKTIGDMQVDTSENWAKKTSFVPDVGMIIVYSDRDVIYDQGGNPINVPGIKIGDGNAYVVDLPFIDDSVLGKLAEHIDDSTKHISSSDRQFWNNKLNYAINDENLIFNRN